MSPVVDAVEPDDILERVDVNALLDRIDVERLLDRIDVEQLVDRIDVNMLLDRIDTERFLDRVDMDQLVERIDVDALVRRTGIEEIVQRSTRGVVRQALDLARRQIVGVDLVLQRAAGAVLRRAPHPEGTAVTGAPAGPATRLLAFALDSVLITTLFGLGVSVADYVADLVLPNDWRPEAVNSAVWLGVFAAWWVSYFVAGWAIPGRTPGMALVGLRVLRGAGGPVSFEAALVRAVFLPFVFVFGIGALGIVVGERHRALHDVVAGTVVVYDWGDRPAAAPAPLARWLVRHGVEVEQPAPRAAT